MDSFDEVFRKSSFTEDYLEKASNEAFAGNRVNFFKRNLTGEEACKEMYKMGARRIMDLLWGLDSSFQFEKLVERRKKEEEQTIIDDDL